MSLLPSPIFLGYQSSSDGALWLICYPSHHNPLSCSHHISFCTFWPNAFPALFFSALIPFGGNWNAEIARTSCAHLLLGNGTVGQKQYWAGLN